MPARLRCALAASTTASNRNNPMHPSATVMAAGFAAPRKANGTAITANQNNNLELGTIIVLGWSETGYVQVSLRDTITLRSSGPWVETHGYFQRVAPRRKAL